MLAFQPPMWWKCIQPSNISLTNLCHITIVYFSLRKLWCFLILYFYSFPFLPAFLSSLDHKQFMYTSPFNIIFIRPPNTFFDGLVGVFPYSCSVSFVHFFSSDSVFKFTEPFLRAQAEFEAILLPICILKVLDLGLHNLTVLQMESLKRWLG